MAVHCILLAAGSSRRMVGANKLLLPIGDGESVVQKCAREIAASKFERRVAVVGFEAEAVSREIEGFELVRNDGFASGQHSSIRAGLAKLEAAANDVVFFCLGDQPTLLTTDYDFLISCAAGAADDKSIFVPFHEGERGNPVGFRLRHRAEVLKEPDQDQGCRYLFERYPTEILKIEMPRPSILLDVDTRESYEKYLEVASGSR